MIPWYEEGFGELLHALSATSLALIFGAIGIVLLLLSVNGYNASSTAYTKRANKDIVQLAFLLIVLGVCFFIFGLYAVIFVLVAFVLYLVVTIGKGIAILFTEIKDEEEEISLGE